MKLRTLSLKSGMTVSLNKSSRVGRVVKQDV
jgi:hypothetical protein